MEEGKHFHDFLLTHDYNPANIVIEGNHPVRLFIFLVSTPPPWRMYRYWWNFTQLQYTTWEC